MKTTLHHYFFRDITKEPDKSSYENLSNKLKNLKIRSMESISSGINFPNDNTSYEVDLDTNFLSNNQWNTSENSPYFPNQRVFDWFKFQFSDSLSKTRMGYYLEQTQEMIDIRYNTFKCGFCGNISYSEGFCDKCIESEYLSVKDLFLTKFVRICDSGKKKEEITKEEFNALFPKFLNEQLKRSKRTFLKQIEEEKEEIEKLMSASHIKIKGLEWLYGHDVILKQRVFFYNRTETFHFTVEDKEDVEIFGNSLKGMGFPYKYEVKCR